MIDIETEMREVVRSMGGIVLQDTFSSPPNFDNADFVFHEDKVVVELKCLTEDNVRSDSNEAKVANLWRRCHVKGLVTSRRQNATDWQALPKTIQNQIYEIRTRTIKKRIQKANLQLRETKEHLGLGDYRGVVLLANDGIRSLSASAFIHAAQLALRRDFREVRHFVFLTANLFTQIRDERRASLFWIGFDMKDDDPIPNAFLDRLGAAWRTHYQRVAGFRMVEEELQDIEGFWNSRYVGNSAWTSRE
jgi:hypothetical protein